MLSCCANVPARIGFSCSPHNASALFGNAVFEAVQSDDPDQLLKKRAKLEAQVDKLKREMQQSLLSSFRDEAKCRVAVLRKLGHVNAEGVVQLKGKAACEIDTADELLCTELMFNGFLSDLDKHQLAAVLSCLIPTEPSEEDIQLKRELAGPLSKLQVCCNMLHCNAIVMRCTVDCLTINAFGHWDCDSDHWESCFWWYLLIVGECVEAPLAVLIDC